MSRTVCPECMAGIHTECIGQGCYCICQAPDAELPERECPHGTVYSMCEQCAQEEQ
jgi:hypothetical protein